MIRLSDFVTQFIVDQGVKEVFLVSGGGIMHLTDAVGKQRGLRYICNYHEQACAIAAEGYARLTKSVGVCVVTPGPGSTNALSGLAGAWVDSMPVVVISGQVRRDLIADYSKLRQVGPQEINIIDMAKPVTKYAVTVMDPTLIRYELEKAFACAISGRQGPVWVNIPLDVQGAMIDESQLSSYFSESDSGLETQKIDSSLVAEAVGLLEKAQRPVFILGNGVHQAKAADMLAEFIEAINIPALMTIGGMDLVDDKNPLCMGRFGPIGQRRANFTLQNSDLVISLGASMSVASIGFNTLGFAPKATKVMVNIDAHEFQKPNFTPDLAIEANVRWFMEEFLRQFERAKQPVRDRWLEACCSWRENYPTVTPDYFEDSDHVNSYVFANALSELLPSDAVVLTGNSLDATSVYHSFKNKLGQRVFTNINFGAMGWDLPAAIGACLAHSGRTVLVTGDGSVQFNIQELLTLAHNKLDLKIFILNNKGYEAIRATQNNFFDGNLVGADDNSGVGNPDFQKLAEAYGIHYSCIANNDQIDPELNYVLALNGPVICELNISSTQKRTPKTMSVKLPDGSFETRPLEDQYPFLPREEVQRNMSLFDEE